MLMYQVIKDNKELLEGMVLRKSISVMPSELLKAIEYVCKENNINWCNKCPRTLLSRIKQVLEIVNKMENGNKKKSSRKTSK